LLRELVGHAISFGRQIAEAPAHHEIDDTIIRL
jgi:hypothetical protein